MGVALLLARILLATLFAGAGLAKLADRAGTRKAAVDFGAPDRLAGPLAVALPLAEVAAAALLLPASTALWGAAAALCLLGVFTAAIAAAMARGRAPDCHCFGQLHSEPAGWKALARNGVLAALGGLVVAGGPGPSAVAWVAQLGGAGVAALALGLAVAFLVAAGGWALLHLLRSYGRVLVRLERLEQALAEAGISLEEHQELPEVGLAPGSEAPAFALRNVLGDTVTLESLLAPGRPLLLLFTSPSCGPCRALMPVVSRWQREHAEALTIALASAGEADTVRAEAEAHGLVRVLLDEALEVYRAYQASGTPSAVLVSPEGTIGSWVAAGSDRIEQLLADALAEPDGGGGGLPVGTPIPTLSLEDLDGGKVDLAERIRTQTLLLFWNPSCGFCRAMHGQLRAWEENPGEGAPELIVISSGSAEETRQEGFRSTVLLDGAFEAGNALGATGTPMAVLVDAEGRIASELAAGAEAVLDLAAANGGAARGS